MRVIRALSILSVVAATMLVGTASAEAAIPTVNFGSIVANSCHPPGSTGCLIKTTVFRNKTDHAVRFNAMEFDTNYTFSITDNTCEQPVGGPYWFIPVGGRCSVTIYAHPQSIGTVTGAVKLLRDDRVIRQKNLVVTGV